MFAMVFGVLGGLVFCCEKVDGAVGRAWGREEVLAGRAIFREGCSVGVSALLYCTTILVTTLHSILMYE